MRLVAVLFVGLLIGCNTTDKQEEQVSKEESTIREARALSNQAIAEHDTLAIDDVWMDNFLVISSRNYQAEGKEENRKLFINEFTTKPDVIYIRTPNKIEVMESWNMASETGTWEGRWTDQENKIEIGGTYYAKWHNVEGRWLLRVEVFTPTRCSGGPYCESQPLNP